MKLAIQRQCDGTYPGFADEPRCDIRLEIDTTVSDQLDPVAFQSAWTSIATVMGWRRFGGGGEPSIHRMGGAARPQMIVVPETKTWIMCPACVEKGGYRCKLCLNPDPACSCDETWFDVISAGSRTDPDDVGAP